MYQLRALVDDDLCRIGCSLNSQSIGYEFDSLYFHYFTKIQQHLLADWLTYATLRHFDVNRFVATVTPVTACQDMFFRLLCRMLQYRVRAEKD